MLRLFLLIGVLLATVSCSDPKSDTLAPFGNYRNVGGAWRERTDSLDGPKKFLAYDVGSDDKRATLTVGCFNNSYTTAVAMNGAHVWPLDTKAVVVIGRGTESVNEPFVVLRGEKDLRPGRGTSQDAHRFISSLRDKKRLDFKLRSVIGIETRDRPLGFDVRGAQVVARNLEVACHEVN